VLLCAICGECQFEDCVGEVKSRASRLRLKFSSRVERAFGRRFRLPVALLRGRGRPDGRMRPLLHKPTSPKIREKWGTLSRP
jgi:hypothetical protein